MATLEKALRGKETRTTAKADIDARCRARAKLMLSDLRKNNPKAAAMVEDPSPHVSGLSARRGGKTYSGTSAALITGEAKPGAVSIIISLNKKQLKRLYWETATSGVHAIARKYDLGLEYNGTDLRWTHQNGSLGYLLGADDDEQIEVMRGLEADLYLIDECKSFAPLTLSKVIDDIIDPARASRKGRLILIGTPGNILSGPFYQATCPTAKDATGKPYLLGIDESYLPTERVDRWGRTAEKDLLWSCHHWSMAENTAMPHQWESALRSKGAKGIADSDPTWRREYLGQWGASGGSGLVYHYSSHRSRCVWEPVPTDDNPTGLPAEGAPWHLVAGLDIGYEAPTAFVLGAYSRRLGELRHVADYSHRHLLPADIAAMIAAAEDKFGAIEKIYCDTGNLGKMVVESLIRDYGFPMERAEKSEKYDHIELVNGSLAAGRIKIIPGTILESQLLTNAWKLPDERPETVADLARRGKLREDDAIENDSADAFLYMYRGSCHLIQDGGQAVKEPETGSVEWIVKHNKVALAKARAEVMGATQARGLPNPPHFIRRAMRVN